MYLVLVVCLCLRHNISFDALKIMFEYNLGIFLARKKNHHLVKNITCNLNNWTRKQGQNNKKIKCSNTANA